MNICGWCNKDCSFVSTCEGLCVECGDKMQTMPLAQIIAGLAKAVADVARLEAENAGLRAEVERLRIESAEWRGFLNVRHGTR